jgi:deoxyribodipyrimidine photo-lyase
VTGAGQSAGSTLRIIVWFRGKDLRIADHIPLREALATGEVIPLFVIGPYFFAPERARAIGHRIQFLLESLRALQGNLAARGSRLVLVAGKSVEVVPRLAREWRADRVVAQRWVEPFARERDRRVAEALQGKLELYEGETLLSPGTLRTGHGTPYSVFTPFAQAFRRTAAIENPLAAPRALPPLPGDIEPGALAVPSCGELGIVENPRLLAGGERAARQRLRRFVLQVLPAYAEQRDRLDLPGTSRLSADLKFGTISARQVWTEIERSRRAG